MDLSAQRAKPENVSACLVVVPGGALPADLETIVEEPERNDFSSNRHPAPAYSWSMIFSENRYPLFGIMLSSLPTCRRPARPRVSAVSSRRNYHESHAHLGRGNRDNALRS
jgi:hypothetical protein